MQHKNVYVPPEEFDAFIQPALQQATKRDALPPWLERYFLLELNGYLESGQYVSAQSLSNLVLQLSATSNMSPDLMRAANMAQNVLESKGYSEKRFLESIVEKERQVPMQCPADTQHAQSDGTCPAGWMPLGSTGGKCCAKMAEVMDQNVESLIDKVRQLNSASARQDIQELEQRFAMKKGSDARLIRDATFKQPLPKSGQSFMRNSSDERARQLGAILQQEEAKGPTNSKAHEALGISSRLYATLKSVLGAPKDIARWFVKSDYMYLWYWVMFLRAIQMVICSLVKFGGFLGAASAFWTSLGTLAGMKAGVSGMAFPVVVYLLEPLVYTSIAQILMNALLAGVTSMGSTVLNLNFNNVFGFVGQFQYSTYILTLFGNVAARYDFIMVIKDIFVSIAAAIFAYFSKGQTSIDVVQYVLDFQRSSAFALGKARQFTKSEQKQKSQIGPDPFQKQSTGGYSDFENIYQQEFNAERGAPLQQLDKDMGFFKGQYQDLQAGGWRGAAAALQITLCNSPIDTSYGHLVELMTKVFGGFMGFLCKSVSMALQGVAPGILFQLNLCSAIDALAGWSTNAAGGFSERSFNNLLARSNVSFEDWKTSLSQSLSSQLGVWAQLMTQAVKSQFAQS